MASSFAKLPVLADDALLWLHERRDRLGKYGLVGALVFFAGGLIWAFRSTPDFGSTLNLPPLLFLLVLSAPAGTILNAIELHALSRIAGGPMAWRTSVELTLYTSATNMLPIPGGAVTKLAGMKAHGSGYRAASAMILLSFAMWGALAFLYSGAALAALGAAGVGAGCLLCGLILLIVCAFAFARFGHWRDIAIVAATRLASIVLDAIRFILALAAFGLSASLLQASALVLSSFVGAAVVIAPQGLGVSEASAALLSTFVGLSAATGFFASAIGRIARLIGLALIAIFLLALRRAPVHSGSR